MPLLEKLTNNSLANLELNNLDSNERKYINAFNIADLEIDKLQKLKQIDSSKMQGDEIDHLLNKIA